MTAANDLSVILSNPMRCSRTRPGPIEATALTVYFLIGERSPPIPLVKVTESPRKKYLLQSEMSHSQIYTRPTMRTSLTNS